MTPINDKKMDKYQNKYRIKSNRMPGWNYAANAMYFITIVTQKRVCNLGEIIETDDHAYMQLSDFGKIVKTGFLKSFEIRNELFLSDYIIMPNHIHAIIVLDNTSVNNDITKKIKQNMPFRQPKSISSFLAGFKSAVNTNIDNYINDNNLDIPKYNKNNHFFQPNYHDHIIRNQNEYKRISVYIKNNPAKWINDVLNKPSKI